MKKVEIPLKMQKFYGSGIMLHPDKEMIESLLRKVPKGKVVTIDELCQKMAHDHQTNVTCPMRTSNIIKSITEASVNDKSPIPFWRVVRKNHLLINSAFTEICASNLKKEGLEVKQNNKEEFKLLNVEERLFSFS